MKKIIWKELKEDDPIFKQGFVISSNNKRHVDLVKIPKKMSRKEKFAKISNRFISELEAHWNTEEKIAARAEGRAPPAEV